MDGQNHFLLMAHYNARMNKQVFEQARTLSDDQLHSDRGAYFSSVMGTLNHILVGDLIWLARFSIYSERYTSLVALSSIKRPQALDDMLYASIADLFEARMLVDRTIIQWLESEAIASDFAEVLEYSNTKGIVSKRNFGELVSHLFNHQTHHRGQVSTLLHQAGRDIGATDFLLDIPVDP
ncbi:DinB family protein [Photobacterium japonica]|uniref:DinB family protein n=1 Tax=Photobacterium japonica TaxID=2910235 RepID=UPI003D11F9D8